MGAGRLVKSPETGRFQVRISVENQKKQYIVYDFLITLNSCQTETEVGKSGRISPRWSRHMLAKAEVMSDG